MPVYRSIRIQMPDRPGALAAISTALAAEGVDIVRLDIVGHAGYSVVDDLLLRGGSAEAIGRAVENFHPDVSVRTFEETSGDPTLAMGEGLMATANAASRDEAFALMAHHASRLARADNHAVASAQEDGSITFAAGGPSAALLIGPEEPFAGRWALHRQAAVAFPVDEAWAPQQVRNLFPAAWIAMAPLGPFDLLVLLRALNIAFLVDELERIAAFAEVSGAMLRLRGQLSSSGSRPAGRETALPATALTVARHERLVQRPA